jgi:hypothetical protein
MSPVMCQTGSGGASAMVVVTSAPSGQIVPT